MGFHTPLQAFLVLGSQRLVLSHMFYLCGRVLYVLRISPSALYHAKKGQQAFLSAGCIFAGFEGLPLHLRMIGQIQVHQG